MRKQVFMKKIVNSVMALAVAFIFMPAINVHAASEYTVTFRPGNVGQFGISSEGEKSVKDMAQEVADFYYTQYETTVTENGAIKVKVPAGADMPVAPAYIIPDTGYCVRTWGPQQGEKVTKNVDYVVDYGRLTDGVEYTVKYVDEVSGESVAPFLTAYANIGDTITVNAPVSITNSNAGVYDLTSVASQSITLTEEASSNVITFTYAYSYDAGTIIEDVVVFIPGDTVVTTETYTTYIDNGTTVVPGAVDLQGGQEEAVVEEEVEVENEPEEEVEVENQPEEEVEVENQPEEEVEVENQPEEEVEVENQQEEEVEVENQPEEEIGEEEQNDEEEFVNIGDEETPLADGTEESATEESSTVIEEEETPLSTFDKLKANSVVVLAGAVGVLAIAVGFLWVKAKKKRY